MAIRVMFPETISESRRAPHYDQFYIYIKLHIFSFTALSTVDYVKTKSPSIYFLIKYSLVVLR